MHTTKPSYKRCRCSGFTLIEMMIVLLIISVLLMIAIPSYLTVRRSSQERLCCTHLRHLQDAKERWAMENKKENTDTPTSDELIPDYIKETPKCPCGGEYELGSVGENAACTIPNHKIY
ncbi:MAG: prepilin-type N-terminal cleavage/methylation domain-containing protein [Armatimonadota bacterium]